ncbi:5'-nucleotidase C-terminal domain-containing protein [Haliangium sp.]|uniref:5'-nucleotidase C-terminal domain-containing protein n=1 Tax=Haliangium sp. TaxID=2663208 RepID=UPI003D0D0E90
MMALTLGSAACSDDGADPPPPPPPPEINQPPQAEADFVDSFVDMTVTVDVLANDTDPDGDTITLVGLDSALFGTTSLDGDQVTYQPSAGFTGTDVFSYRIEDGNGGSARALVLVVVSPGEPPPPPTEIFKLALFHNNDGESALIGDDDFGGAARFLTALNGLRTRASADGRAVVTLSSGDNYLASAALTVSQRRGRPFFDSLVLGQMGYDALALGNHEFDFGPDFLADMITDTTGDVPFLSANLDVSGEPSLAALATAGRIAKSTVVTKQGRQIGIIGATTPNLPNITSPGAVTVGDVATAVQAEVDALESAGVNIIILISHLQSVDEDRELAAQLRGVDVIIAGGGDELLADAGRDLLIPGDETEIFGSYPLLETDADGGLIPVVTTSGQYRYIGQLNLSFDEAGALLLQGAAGDANRDRVDPGSGPKRVAGGAERDSVLPDVTLQTFVIDPLDLGLAEIRANVIADLFVPLDGRRTQIRSRETNQGNLIADAFLHTATRLAQNAGSTVPTIALANGGGIRNDDVVEAGVYTELDTFDALPFANFLVVVPDVTPAQLKRLMENAVSRTTGGGGSGRFPHIAGFRVVYDDSQPGLTFDQDNNGVNIATEGSRITDIFLDDGTPIIEDGAPAAGAPNVHIATVDFLARGGDQYPFFDYDGSGNRIADSNFDFDTFNVPYQRALFDYVTRADGLNGLIDFALYPEKGLFADVTENRVQRRNVPIHTIQGAAHASPLEGIFVRDVTGVVTAVGTRFPSNQQTIWMQAPDAEADGDDATSEGIIVFAAAPDHGCAQGNQITVRGQVREIGFGADLSVTQIQVGNVGAITCSGTVALPTPVVIGSGGRVPPDLVIDDDITSTAEESGSFDAGTDGLDFWESMESMHARINNPIVVGPTRSFGEIYVLTDGGTIPGQGPRTARGGIRLDDAAGDFNPEIVTIEADEVGIDANAPQNVEPQVQLGDSFTGSIDGVIAYAFGKFQLRPYVNLPTPVTGTLPGDPTSLVGDATRMTVATFNVLNLDPGDGPAKYDALAAIIVNDMGSPDVIGLQEMQDDSGPTDNGEVSAALNGGLLVASIGAAGGPTYQYAEIAPVNLADGGQPGANIRVGYLVNTARATLVARGTGDAITAAQVVDNAGTPELSPSPGRVDPQNPAWADGEVPGFAGTRKPLAAEFVFVPTGATVFVVNNHLKSKSGDNSPFGRIQPPVFGTEVQREAQTQVVNDFVAEILAVDANARVVVLGDMNEHETRSPISVLAGDILTNLIERVAFDDQYTFNFNGNSQILDHVLVSDALEASAEIDIVHVNSEVPDAVKASDHDPIVVRITP